MERFCHHILIVSICYFKLVSMQSVIDRLALPDGANCGDKIPAYLVMDSYKVLTDDKLFYENVEEDECKIMCSDNKDDKGTSILCASFNYNIKSRLCSINRGKATPVGKLQLKPAVASRYYEKICLPDHSPANCGDAPFFRANQAVLVGYAKNTTKAKDLSACVDKCIATKGECKSAMYFAESGECILNAASAQGAPDVFIDETDEENVVYFENGCVMANQIRSQSTVTASASVKLSRGSTALPTSTKRKSGSTDEPVAKSTARNSTSSSATTKPDTEDDDEEGDKIVQARRLSTPAGRTTKAKANGESAVGDKKLAEYGPWAAWSQCDRPDGRRYRKRKCPKRKRCRGLDIETQWCSDVDESQLLATNRTELNDASDLDDGAGLGELTTEDPTTPPSSSEAEEDEEEPTTTESTRRPKITRAPSPNRTTPSSVTTPAPDPSSEKWSAWSEQCRPFDDPNGCRFGTRLGFQTRQCLRSPFECQGPFFRYCIIAC